MSGIWKQPEKKTRSCETCMQPVNDYNMFAVSWIEDDVLVSRLFCGSRCLRDWANEHSENVKLELFNP
jgi:hypothetical protein